MRIWIAPFLLLVGCSGVTEPASPPVYAMFVPEGESEWRTEVGEGFKAGAAQFGEKAILIPYSTSQLRTAKDKLGDVPSLDHLAVTVVALDSQAAAELAEAFTEAGRPVVTVGVDAAASGRVATVTFDCDAIAKLWNIRREQTTPNAKNILFVFSDDPIPRKILESEVFRRSSEWKEFRPKFLSLDEVDEESLAWADAVTPVGEAAYLALRERGDKPLIPVSSCESVLRDAEGGAIANAITPNYFDLGLRAFRLAREHYVTAGLGTVALALHPNEVDQESVQIYRDRRRHVPDIVRKPRK